MTQGIRPPHETYVDPARRRALLALLDDGFPKLGERIAAAATMGYRWEEVTEPFVAWDGDAAIGHVGVLAHRALVAGEVIEVAGLHAVVTRHDRRGRGIARRLLDEALAWADARYPLAKLATDLPGVYAPHGFRPVLTHRFHVEHRGGEDHSRALDPGEQDRLHAILDARDPISHVFASLDPGWLVGIDLALQRRSLADLRALDDLDAIVDWEVTAGGVLRLHDVFARSLPPLEELLARAPRHERVELWCCADRLAPAARPEPLPDGGWMLRGDWPALGPIAVSRLAEH